MLSVLPHRELKDHRALSAFCSVPENEISAISSNTEIETDCAADRSMRILICVNGVLKHVNTPDSYLRERCANIVDSVRSLA